MSAIFLAIIPLLIQLVTFLINKGAIRGKAIEAWLSAIEASRADGSFSVKIKQSYADLVRQHLKVEPVGGDVANENTDK